MAKNQCKGVRTTLPQRIENSHRTVEEKNIIEVKGAAITVLSHKEADYICITDIARFKNAEHTDDLIRNWIRNRNTIEFLGIWEKLNNLNFNPVEFDGIKIQAGLNSFTLTPSSSTWG